MVDNIIYKILFHDYDTIKRNGRGYWNGIYSY